MNEKTFKKEASILGMKSVAGNKRKGCWLPKDLLEKLPETCGQRYNPVELTNWMWFSVVCTLYTTLCVMTVVKMLWTHEAQTTFNLPFTTISTSKKAFFLESVTKI